MINPFDVESQKYSALVNDEGRYSLWPAHMNVPAGWRVAHAADTREACLEYIEWRWVEMQPVSR
ncbi:MbtH family protein [Streptomyces sp. NPDC006463]|uniref:MbtH family protein n=1 Tax=Streptomyces sp. NPDC006463 TaxID=3364746 RepID=UPI0036B44E5B